MNVWFDRRTSLRNGIAAVMTLVMLGACGGSPGAGSTTATGHDSKAYESLNVSIVLHTISFAALYVAQAEGYFADEKLSVNVSIDPTFLTSVVAGQTDVAITSPLSGILASIKGEQVENVFAWQYDAYAALISSAKYTSVAQLQSLSSCRMGSLAPGSQVYAYAVRFKQVLGLKCDIIVASSYALLAAGLKAGSYDVAAMSGFVAAQTLSGGGVNILIDPLQSDFVKKYALPTSLTADVIGLPAHLKTKSVAVTRFLRAIIRAEKDLTSKSQEQIAAILQKQQPETFGSLTVDNIKLQMKYSLPSITKPGYIAPSLWASCLKSYEMWQAQGFSSSDPAAAYAKSVDMSYYNSAGGAQ